MAASIDPARVDEVCSQMRKFAETIERLLSSKSAAVSEKITDMTEAVAEVKRQLGELAKIADMANLTAKQATTVLNLRNRYDIIEGTLKEHRNDLGRGLARSTNTAGRLQAFPGEGKK